MAYNIVLSSNQSFTTTDPIPEVNWQFDQPNPIVINHFAGTSQPANIDIATVIRNYLAYGYDIASKSEIKQKESDFQKIYVTAEIEHPVVNKAIKQVLQVTGAIADAPLPGYELTENNLEVTTTLEFNSFNSLLPGSLETHINFIVKGELITGQLVEIDRIPFSVLLNILSQTQTKLSLNQINFYQPKSETLRAAQTLDITAFGEFAVEVPEYINLSGPSLSLITTVDGYKTYQGQGSQTVSISLNTTILSTPVGAYEDILIIESATGTTETLSLNTTIVEQTSAAMIVTPPSLFWELIQGVSVQSQIVKVEEFGNTPVQIESQPSWLNIIITLNIPNLALLSVVPVNTAFLSPGQHSGAVVIKSGSLSATLEVTLLVISNVNIGLSTTGINFSDDFETITKFYNSSLFNIKLRLFPVTRTFFPYQHNQTRLDYLFGIHNNYAEFFLGKVVRNLFEKLNQLEQINYPFLPSSSSLVGINDPIFLSLRRMYLPASINWQSTFVNRQTDEIISTENWTNIQMIRGRKPPRFSTINSTQIAILDFFTAPTRVTKTAVKFLNFYTNTAVSILIFRNGVFFSNRNISHGEDRIFNLRLEFFSFTEGDVIEVKLSRSQIGPGNVFLSQQYIMLPQGKDSYHIGWVNEYELLETIEFHGSITSKVSLEQKTVFTYKHFLEKLEKLDVKQGQSITCNTGFVLKEDARRIADLMRSKKAFLMSKTPTLKNIEMIPLSKEIQNIDTDRDLYDYEVEFQINIPNDSEIYPR